MRPFAYFKSPTQPLSTWSEKASPCYFCGQSGPGFDGPYYGDLDELERVCESCLRAGKLETVDMTTRSPDERHAARQLLVAQPSLGAGERESLLSERSRVLTQRTPGLVAWQDFQWPSHCGDYCQFVEELGKAHRKFKAGILRAQLD